MSGSDFELETTVPVIRRSWTRAERRTLLGSAGARIALAVEPMLCGLIFAAMTAGLVAAPLPAQRTLDHGDVALVLAPLFALGAIALVAYAASLLIAPLRALRRTFRPIYIVDGYLRYRRPDRRSDPSSNGYVAVLDERRQAVAEWASFGPDALSETVRPALVEFCAAGGIHRIDGQSAAR